MAEQTDAGLKGEPRPADTLRVLLSAHLCAPGLGSVSQIGWEWYRRLSTRVHVTLITHIRNREALIHCGAPIGDSEITFIDTEWFASPLYRSAKWLFPRSEHATFMMSGLDFFVFDRAARRAAINRLEAGQYWDIVHAVTPVTTMAATRLYGLGAPLVRGPLNSGISTPKGFRSILRDEYRFLFPLRNLGRPIDALAGSIRNTDAILIANQTTAARIPPRYRSRCITMLENGVDLDLFKPAPWPPPPSASESLKILFVGRLVPLKGVDLLLEAVARIVSEFPVELVVIGDGPSGPALRIAAERYGLANVTKFIGPQTPEEVAFSMRAAHVLCLPSIRESAGAVLLEAMASARPVIAVAFGGPAEIVDNAVGRAIAPNGIEGVVAGLAEALRDLVREPEAWRRRGEEGRRRAVASYGWDAKIERALELYRHLIGLKCRPTSDDTLACH